MFRCVFATCSAVGTCSRAIRGSTSDERVGCSASDGRYAPARPALHVWNASVDVRRRTRPKAYTIRGAAPEVTIGRLAADRAGARPYRASSGAAPAVTIGRLAADRSPARPRRAPGAERQTPNAKRQTPNAKRQTPNAKRQTPNAKRQTPNAKRQTPNAKRQTPNAKRRTPNAKRYLCFWRRLECG